MRPCLLLPFEKDRKTTTAGHDMRPISVHHMLFQTPDVLTELKGCLDCWKYLVAWFSFVLRPDVSSTGIALVPIRESMSPFLFLSIFVRVPQLLETGETKIIQKHRRIHKAETSWGRSGPRPNRDESDNDIHSSAISNRTKTRKQRGEFASVCSTCTASDTSFNHR